MCIAFPAQIVSVTGNSAQVLILEQSRTVLLVVEAAVGDWVLVSAGAAIQRVSAEFARESLELLNISLTGKQHEAKM